MTTRIRSALAVNPDETIGQRIARLRKARGWTQYALAAEAGVHRWTVGRWELNRMGQHRRHSLLLAVALNVDVSDLEPTP